MYTGLKEKLLWTSESLPLVVPELILTAGIFILLLTGLIKPLKHRVTLFHAISLLIFIASLTSIVLGWFNDDMPVKLFNGMVRRDTFSTYLKILFNASGILTVLMTWSKRDAQKHFAEYYILMVSVVLGAHFLVMSLNFIMIFISLEIVSICSYVLAGFSFTKHGAEGSLKYFLFGAVASAIMLYGLTILYGITTTMDYSSPVFQEYLVNRNSKLILTACLMVLAGFLYKIAAVPMHPWAPDIYEASPMAVVAFFSVVPKLAGLGILTKFLLSVYGFGQSAFDWQLIMSVVAIFTLTVGNFAALNQKNPKRLMAYSSIAQSGFLLVGMVTFLPQGLHVMLFYATIYALANFAVFVLLQFYENNGIHTIAEYNGVGKVSVLSSVLLLIGLITLTGLPPTSGFTGKLFIFTSLWDAYTQSDKPVLLWLLVFGLMNTVVALFYYLRIPYYAFMKSGNEPIAINNPTFQNLLGLILVLIILILFFQPGILMGWINKINFVL